ncbi:crotonobetaine/carnitine-CoA ligase [Sphingomonas vulcanisoli]|uniref:Crotonobetaine/carnitine-CoA ligase n=1 Tax=Sphingomonas vulcanisoli TaxID=1658060 RepID=A0ABX0TTA0_9SPHN|nr:crotonobetaine/carnitine-CoA ligase [Sphingomonas vulcanisoli]
MSDQSLFNRLAKFGDRPFLITDHGTHTYAEIADRAARFGSLLQAKGVQRGDHVALLAGNSAAYIVAWFGISMTGAVLVALNNQLLADGLRYTVDQSESKIIVADRAWHEKLGNQLTEDQRKLPLVLIGSDEDFFESLSPFEQIEAVSPEPWDTATILYTSGTTGLPKGVMNSYHAYEATGLATANLVGLHSEDRILVFLPLFHVNPQMFAVMGAITVGASIIIRPKFNASTFFDDARRFDATGCTFVGTVLALLVNRHPGVQKDHRLRFCIGGGAAPEVWSAIEERFGFPINESYGMTEIGGWTSSNSLKDTRFGSVGRVREDIELRVVDPQDRPVPPGVRGEIVARPREPFAVMSGYWNKPDKFVEATRNLWFHTGDIGSFDADGYLYFHGRIKELIRRGGEMISPVEMETRLITMPGVEDCAIVGVPDAVMGEEVKAVVVAGEPIEPAAIRSFLADHFPPYMLPRYVRFIDVIPKTATQKIQRGELTALDASVADLR